jgi:hypothetical protein
MENHERKLAFSIAFEPTKLKRIKEIVHKTGAHSVGEFVREAVDYHVQAAEDIIRRMEREGAISS